MTLEVSEIQKSFDHLNNFLIQKVPNETGNLFQLSSLNVEIARDYDILSANKDVLKRHWQEISKNSSTVHPLAIQALFGKEIEEIVLSPEYLNQLLDNPEGKEFQVTLMAGKMDDVGVRKSLEVMLKQVILQRYHDRQPNDEEAKTLILLIETVIKDMPREEVENFFQSACKTKAETWFFIIELLFEHLENEDKYRIFRCSSFEVQLKLIGSNSKYSKYIKNEAGSSLMGRAIQKRDYKSLKNLTSSTLYDNNIINYYLRHNLHKPKIVSLLLNANGFEALDKKVRLEIKVSCDNDQVECIPAIFEYCREQMNIGIPRYIYRLIPETKGSKLRELLLPPHFTTDKFESLYQLPFGEFTKVVSQISLTSVFLLLALDDDKMSEDQINVLIEALSLTDVQTQKLITKSLYVRPQVAFSIADRIKDAHQRMIAVSDILKSQGGSPFKQNKIEKYLREGGQAFIQAAKKNLDLVHAIMRTGVINELIQNGSVDITPFFKYAYKSNELALFKRIYTSLTHENAKKVLGQNNCSLLRELPGTLQYKFYAESYIEKILSFLVDKYHLELGLLNSTNADELLLPLLKELQPELGLLLPTFTLISKKAKQQVFLKTNCIYNWLSLLEETDFELDELTPEVRDEFLSRVYGSKHILHFIKKKYLGAFKKIIPYVSVGQLQGKELAHKKIYYLIGLDEKFLPLLNVNNWISILIISLRCKNEGVASRILFGRWLTNIIILDIYDAYFRVVGSEIDLFIQYLKPTDQHIEFIINNRLQYQPEMAFKIAEEIKDKKRRMISYALIMSTNLEYGTFTQEYVQKRILINLEIDAQGFIDACEPHKELVRCIHLVAVCHEHIHQKLKHEIDVTPMLKCSYRYGDLHVFNETFSRLTIERKKEILSREGCSLLSKLIQHSTGMEPSRERILNLLIDKYQEFQLLEPIESGFVEKIPAGKIFVRVFGMLSAAGRQQYIANTIKPTQLMSLLQEPDLINLEELGSEVREDLFKRKEKGFTLFDNIAATNLFVFRKVIPFVSVEQLLNYVGDHSIEAIGYFVGLDEKYLPLITERNLMGVLIACLKKCNLEGFLRILGKHTLTEDYAIILIGLYFKNTYPTAFIVCLLNVISPYNHHAQEDRIVEHLIRYNCQGNVIEFMSEKLRGEKALEYFGRFRDNKNLADLIFSASSEKIQEHIKAISIHFNPQQKLDFLPFWSVQEIINLANAITLDQRIARMKRVVSFDGNSLPLHTHIRDNIGGLIDKVESNSEVSNYFSDQLTNFINVITAEDIASTTPEVQELLVRYIPYLPLSKMKVLMPLLKPEDLNAFLSMLTIDKRVKYLKYTSKDQKENFLSNGGLKNKAVENWNGAKEFLNTKLQVLREANNPNSHQELEKDFLPHFVLISGENIQKIVLDKLKEVLIDAGETSDVIEKAFNAYKTTYEDALKEAKDMREALTVLVQLLEPLEYKDFITEKRMDNPVIVTDNDGNTFVVDESTVSRLNGQNPTNRVPFKKENVKPHTELKKLIDEWVKTKR